MNAPETASATSPSSAARSLPRYTRIVCFAAGAGWATAGETASSATLVGAIGSTGRGGATSQRRAASVGASSSAAGSDGSLRASHGGSEIGRAHV